jgi:DNA topoisomerase I
MDRPAPINHRSSARAKICIGVSGARLAFASTFPGTKHADVALTTTMSAKTITQSAKADADAAGLRYVSDEHPGIRRLKHGTGFGYAGVNGKPIADPAVLKRIHSVAVPPAWTDVWISPSANGHIQATGRDARGRKQYCYHPDFRVVRDATKYEHLVAFGEALPKLRREVEHDMHRHGLPREKIIAVVIHLLDTLLIRVGNSAYAKDNRSFGLTTLRNRHVKINGGELRFEFRGKSGRVWRLKLHDRRVARIVRSAQELPGQQLFQYLDETGSRASLGSADVNDYLRRVTGMDITAKDFRTFAGTVLAANALAAFPPFDTEVTAKVNIRAAIEEVAGRLGNTPAVCRKCYIHPAILETYLEGELTLMQRGRRSVWLTPEEAAVIAFLQQHLRDGKRRKRRASKPSPTQHLTMATESALSA